MSTTRDSLINKEVILCLELVVPHIECTECVDNFGRFVAEPLEKGFGITLGNSLRRVLLGYLPGAAVTQSQD